MHSHVVLCVIFAMVVENVIAKLQVRYEYIQDSGTVPNDVKFLCGVAYSSSHQFKAVMINETSLECTGLNHEWGLSPAYMPGFLYMVKVFAKDENTMPTAIVFPEHTNRKIPLMFNRGATISITLLLSENWGQFVINLNVDAKTKPLRMMVYQYTDRSNFYHMINGTKGPIQPRLGVEPFVIGEFLTVTFVAGQNCIKVLVNGVDYFCYNHNMDANVVEYITIFRGGNYTGTVDMYKTEMHSPLS